MTTFLAAALIVSVGLMLYGLHVVLSSLDEFWDGWR